MKKVTICDCCGKSIITEMNSPFSRLELIGWERMEDEDKCIQHFCEEC